MSEFWKRKMKTHFKAIDVNKDGVITEEDFHLLGSRLCDKENADAKRRQRVKETLDTTWKAFTKAVHKTGKEPLTESIFIESVNHQRNDPGYAAILEELAIAFLNALDTNADGFLQEDEHRRFFENMGMSVESSVTKIAFDVIDTNHDGKISKDEMARAFIDFMTSEDEKSPFQLFWGPLI